MSEDCENRPTVERRRGSQDIFERINEFRGGNGEVRMQDFVQFLRALSEGIDENIEVGPVVD